MLFVYVIDQILMSRILIAEERVDYIISKEKSFSSSSMILTSLARSSHCYLSSQWEVLSRMDVSVPNSRSLLYEQELCIFKTDAKVTGLMH